jgi:hypothetical protein
MIGLARKGRHAVQTVNHRRDDRPMAIRQGAKWRKCATNAASFRSAKPFRQQMLGTKGHVVAFRTKPNSPITGPPFFC